MPRKSAMGKREQNSLNKILEKLASATGSDLGEMQTQVAPVLNSHEDLHYQAQSVLNFYRARIEPYLGVKEKPEDFDIRYREWRFKNCSNCGERFAYAYNYDGVGTCSLECVEQELARIGMIFSRHHDLKQRWGYFHHPAIVSANALEVLRTLYSLDAPHAFEPLEEGHPIPPFPDDPEQTSYIEELPDNHDSSVQSIP